MGPQEQPQMPVSPQPQPMQAPQPQPGGFGAPQPQMMAPKKGLSKKALTGIIAGGIGLLLLIVGIVLAVVLLGPPSKADYQKAFDKAESMVKKYNSSSSTFSSGTFTDDLKNAKNPGDIDTAVDKVKADYDKDNTELAGMKAMNDAEVKKAFDAYKKKYDAAFPYIKTTLKAYLSYKDVGTKCSYSAISSISYTAKDKASAQADYDSKSKPCLDLLKTFDGSGDQKMKDFAKAYEAYIQKMHDYVGAYADARGKSDYTAMSNLDRPSSLDLPYTSDLMPKSGESDNYEFTTEFNDFVSVLNKKR